MTVKANSIAIVIIILLVVGCIAVGYWGVMLNRRHTLISNSPPTVIKRVVIGDYEQVIYEVGANIDTSDIIIETNRFPTDIQRLYTKSLLTNKFLFTYKKE